MNSYHNKERNGFLVAL